MSYEKYIGVKFRAISASKKRHISKKDNRLLFWCKKFNRLGFAPDYGNGNSGNLSFRTRKGFVITPTASYYDKISVIDFSEVIKADQKQRLIYFNGMKIPSSEAFLHYIIYSSRKDINAIFHGHSDIFLKNQVKFISTIKEMPYGSLALARAAVEAIGKNNTFIILKNHGFVSIGKSIDAAGNNTLEKYMEIIRKTRSKPYPLGMDTTSS